MAKAALNGLEEACHLDVAGGDLDLDNLVVLLLGGVGLAVLVVEVHGDALGQTVTSVTELFVVAVDLVGVVAVGTVAGVHLKAVQGPALLVGQRTGDGEHRVLHEANDALLLGGDGLDVDDGGHGV
jgi:hypothetical protein